MPARESSSCGPTKLIEDGQLARCKEAVDEPVRWLEFQGEEVARCKDVQGHHANAPSAASMQPVRPKGQGDPAPSASGPSGGPSPSVSGLPPVLLDALRLARGYNAEARGGR